jgi:hypothetical protein
MKIWRALLVLCGLLFGILSGGQTPPVAAQSPCADLNPAPPLTPAGAKIGKVVCLPQAGGVLLAAVPEAGPARYAGPPLPVLNVQLVLRGADGWAPHGDLAAFFSGPGGGPPDRPYAFLDLAAVDERGTGATGLVMTTAQVGADYGPTVIRVLSFPQANGLVPQTDFAATWPGNATATVSGQTVTIQADGYAPQDPHCCPSQKVAEQVGWNPTTGRVEVLRRTSRPAAATPAPGMPTTGQAAGRRPPFGPLLAAFLVLALGLGLRRASRRRRWHCAA